MTNEALTTLARRLATTVLGYQMGLSAATFEKRYMQDFELGADWYALAEHARLILAGREEALTPRLLP